MRILHAVLAGSAAALLAASPAVAATHPAARGSVGLTLSTTQVTAGAPFAVSVSSSRVGGRLYLQRTAGSAGVYRNVIGVPKRGTVAAPGVPMGSYSYRVVAVKHRRIVAKSAARTLLSYGNVSAFTLCRTTGNNAEFGGCGTGTIQVGGQVFNYSSTGDADSPTSTDSSVSATRSSCRSLTMSFAVPNDSHSVRTVGAALSTTNSDLQQATTGYGTIGHATFALTSSSWNLILWTDGFADAYWDGTFSCWTPTGGF